MKARRRGFTLVEVLVALVVVAFGVGALLTTLTAAADNVAHLRDKSFAEWIALNRISEIRLSRQQPSVGSSNGEVEYAGTRWRWAQTVSEPQLPGLLQIEVQVSRADAPNTNAAASAPAVSGNASDESPPALATAWGFFAPDAVAPPTANSPDWTWQSLATLPGSGDDKGGDKDGRRPPGAGGPGPPGESGPR